MPREEPTPSAPGLRFAGPRSDEYRYRPFGAFRLVLAALVMMQHFTADLAPAPLARAFAPYAVGSMAVLAFFALSGFVIMEAVDRVYRRRAAAFLGNRLLRIVPHFMLAIALSMLAHELFRVGGGVRLWRSQPSFPLDAFAPANVVLNFLGILPLADRFIHYNFLDITWAVRVEMAFYLIVGGCIAAAGRLSRPRGFVLAACGVSALLTPLFILSVRGHGVGMMAFLPYFVFGGGLYFAADGRRGGWLAVALSIPAMLWQCVSALLDTRSPHGALPSIPGNLGLLVVLLAALALLGFGRLTAWRAPDRLLGNLTYPLYLYHEDVLVVLLTFTTGYSYRVFGAGLVLSLVVAILLAAVVDPVVNRYRDQVRGRRLGTVLPPAGARKPQPLVSLGGNRGQSSVSSPPLRILRTHGS